MRRHGLLGRGIAVALVLGLHATASRGSRAAHEAVLNASSTPPDICESKTINYITHTLPQQCLRTSWTGPAPTATEAATADGTTPSPSPQVTPTDETQREQKQSGDAEQAQDKEKEKERGKEKEEDPENAEFATGSFMSFEEWKEMMVRKSGQDPAKLKDRKPSEHKSDRGDSGANGDLESAIGEEGEISLDFDALSEKVSEMASSSSGDSGRHTNAELQEEPVLYDDGKTQYYRSKDAGKTCKERFSFSSSDGGATVLKTSPGAKNPKATLVENKDSYMLLECHAENKFIIIELSDDILVDTVVLANFEFFSSMIRKFRVSVSDRYPVKIDKWVDLGTFEARNSRDIQPFLVEHPQIYTKYIRIEFLTHYGNEYYCPVSLLRVHGTRMLDTWKEQDNNQDDEVDQIDGPAQDLVAEVNHTQTSSVDAASSNTTAETASHTEYLTEVGLSPWQPMFYYNFSEETCVLWSPTTGEPTPVSSHVDSDSSVSAGQRESATVKASHAPAVSEAPQSANLSSSAAASAQSATASTPPTSPPSSSASSAPPQQPASSNTNSSASGSSSSKQRATARTDTTTNVTSSASRSASSSTASTPTTSRNKTSTASGAPPASPTVQESFFKTVTKRLQLLESNTSLSLQYIEEQSRFLQDALLRMEKKQAGRVDSFLGGLNKTVLAELRTVRTQYDQIWQSTVIALETQREQSQREIVALSARLAVLADEVVFQKRMAILQSVLLLSCLVLVIFSRNGSGSGPARSPSSTGFGPNIAHHFSNSLSSHTNHNGNHHITQQLHYGGDKTLPLTPTSQSSREGTPLVHVGGMEPPLFGDSSPSPPQLQQRRSHAVGKVAMRNGILEARDEDEYEDLAASPGPDGDTEGGSQREDRRYVSQVEFGGIVTIDQESTRSLSKGRSSLPQSGGARKPLPALPEDPT